jgi:hypothetical protein
MAESRRLKGLETLRAFGLPTPKWQEVRSEEDIAALQLGPTSYGWTIRTCRTDGQRETGGFFKNQVSHEDVPAVLHRRADMFGTGEFYIVYPSWRFDMSFNVVFDEGTYIVEGIHGSQKGISDGTQMPEIALQIPEEALLRPVVYIGSYTQPLQAQLGRIISHLRRMPMRRYYTEVALTVDRTIFFYELFPIGPESTLSR